MIKEVGITISKNFKTKNLKPETLNFKQKKLPLHNF